MTAAAPTIPAAPAAPGRIAPHRGRSLVRWNAGLGTLHLAQALVILGLSLAQSPVATLPVVSSYLSFAPALEALVSAQRTLFELPLGPAVALFLLMSAIAHFSFSFLVRGWYERRLARGQNPGRWIEYSLSSSVMIVLIAMLSGIQEVGTIVAVFGVNAAMILFGWSMEAANEGRERPQWLHYVFGCIAGVVPWVVIAIALLTAATGPNAEPIPAFVIAIFVSLFVTFNLFAITMVLQYGRIGRWADYLDGERLYMVLSLVAKSLLAWQVWFGTLAP